MKNCFYTIFFASYFLFSQKSLAEFSHKVDVQIQYDGSYGYELAIKNENNYFLCVSYGKTNTEDGRLIKFKDKNGKDIIPLTFTDSSPYNTHLGFDFAEPYYILQPGEARKFHLNLTVFKIQKGKYSYNLKADVFKCKDVVDEKRIKKNREVELISIEKNGQIDFSEEFIRLNNDLRGHSVR